MTNEISKQSFKEFKLVTKGLQMQVDFDKKNHVNSNEDIDFSNLDDLVNQLAYDYTDSLLNLIGIISNNDDMTVALNLNVVYKQDVTYVYKQDQNDEYNNSMTVLDLLDDFKSATKLGRKGIQRKINKNLMIHKKINKLEAKLD